MSHGRLEEISIEITGYCNLSCAMCGVWRRRQHGIDFQTLAETLAAAHRLGARKFTTSGAEPLTRPDFPEILRLAAEIGFDEIFVVSNGLLMDARRVRALARIGGLRISVSIDGSRESHDRVRGAGTYDRAVAAVGALTGAGIPTMVASVVMRQTLDHLTSVVDLAASLGLRCVSLQPYQPEIGGRGADHAAFGFLTSDEDAVRSRLDEVRRHARRRGVALHTGSMFDLIPAYLARGERPIPKGGCFLPARFLLVDWRGDVYPCFFWGRRRIGSVHDEPLDRLWHNEVRRELAALAQAERCPGCLAACSDVRTYDRVAAPA